MTQGEDGAPAAAIPAPTVEPVPLLETPAVLDVLPATYPQVQFALFPEAVTREAPAAVEQVPLIPKHPPCPECGRAPGATFDVGGRLLHVCRPCGRTYGRGASEPEEPGEARERRPSDPVPTLAEFLRAPWTHGAAARAARLLWEGRDPCDAANDAEIIAEVLRAECGRALRVQP